MNPPARFTLLLGFTLGTLSLNAQDQKAAAPTNQRPQTGTIAGRVLCGDTRTPARLATVLAIPIPVFDAAGNATQPEVRGSDVVKTNLDGNFTLSKIAPGDYFVLAEMRGYLSPVAKQRWTDLKDMTPDAIKNLAKQLPSVHVEPGKSAHADVILERGASISGAVTYDDGTPAIGVYVRIEPALDIAEEDRPLIDGLASNWTLSTDDRGRYRISGLPDGEYVVQASVDGMAHMENPFATANYQPAPEEAYGQMINTTYSEKTLHKKNAKTYKLASGEDRSGADIEIPLHGLYSISGTVRAQGNQPPIVIGFVSLEDLGDKTFTRRAVILSDGTFELYYLPPGKYQLKTANLSDQSPFLTDGQEPKPSYHYAEATTKVEIIDGDLTDITLTIPETAPPTTKGTQKPAAPPESN